MKLLLLLFVAVAANAATLGSRKCSHGPAYWCGTINQAKECGAVQYCLDNHWPNIKTTESSFCTDCKAGISALREELSKASTENEIVNFVEKFCKDLGSLAEDCKLVIDAYGPEVLKALIQELKPEQVCALMGFCKGETVTTDQRKDTSAEILALVMTKSSSKVMKLLLSQVEANADTCKDCTNFLGDVKNLLNNATVEQMITNEIEMVCNILGPYKDECKLIVSTLVPQGIGQLVERIVPKDVCIEIGFCKSAVLGLDEPVPEPPPSDPCSDCKAFMGDVKTILSNATVQKMIIQELESVCNSLGSFAPQCQQYVEQYGPMVLGIALQYFDPNMICSYTGFCKAEDAPRKLLFVPNDLCSDCTTVAKDVITLLKDPNVQTAIVHQLENICDDLGSLGPQCRQYVDEYAPLVFNIALQYLTPSTVCSILGLCAEEPEALPEPGDICTDCKNFVKDFDAVLNNYTVQEKLLKDLLVLCKFIPTYQSECEQYLPQYGGLVFEVIAGLLNPKTICKDIKLCQGETTPVAENVQLSNPEAGDPCSECEAIFKDIQTLLSDPAVQKMIISNVETLCSDLGGLAPICKQYVDQYGPLVINFLIQYIMPQQFCSLAGLCTSDLPEWFLKLKMPQVDGDLCTDCKALVNDADGLLKNATVQKMFLNDLAVVCKYFGGLSSECKQLILEYGPLVFDYLASIIDPTTICDEIGLCPSLINLNADQCTDCTNFFQDVSTILSTPSVQQMILQEIENLCNDLGSLGPQCQQYVSEYGPLVINFLLQYLDPNTVCKEIGFCSGTCQAPPKLFNVNADQCTDCKNFFQDVSTVLNNPTTQQMILQDIENLCNDLGPSLGPQCQQYVSEYGPLVINFLLQYLDPAAICGDIGFCMSVSRPPMKLVSVNADQCTDCKAFVQDIATDLNNPSTQQMILQDIENLCNDLGSLGPQCQQYVSEYGPLVINFLLQYLDPSAVCADIGFCSSLSAPPVNADQCTDCKNFFQDVSTVLNNPATQQMILQDIENLCNDLGPSLGPQCQQYVSEYGPLVINFLLQYLDPTAICGDIGFCSAVSRPPTKLFGVNADQCTDCKNFFQDVSTILNNATVQQMILQEIENLCNDLGSLGPQCQQYVSEYGPLVINFLLQYLDPTAICGDIGFCSAVPRSSAKLFGVNADQCADCKNFFQDVSTVLNNPATQQMILQDIENLCNDLGSLGPQCQQYVSEYGPLVINFLLQYLDPAAICGDIGFCSAVSTPPTKLFGVNADQCTDCKNFFQDVSTVLNNPATQQMILQDIENLCNDLGSLGPQCQQYVSEYGPLVINFLLQYLDPTAICGDIGFCSAVSTPPTKLFGVNADQCTDCKNFFQDVSTVLNNPATQQMILQDIENLCNDLGSLGPQCQQYVSEYGPLVINFLLQYLDPTAICGDIGFCSAVSTPPTKLFGVNADQCTDCKNFFQDVSTVLNNPATQQMILQEIENLCNDLGSLGPQCQQYVSEYGPLVINFLLQYLDPTAICGDIGFCSAVSRPPTKLFGVNADQCTDCKNFFQDVSTILNNATVQQMILQDIENLCNDLGSLGPQCQQYVAEYGPLVINFLLQYLDPTAICADIGFCSAVSRPQTKLFGVSADQCTDCKNFFQDVSTILNNPSTQQMILQDIENLCNDLGPSLGPQCQQYVSEYGPLVINFLLQYLDPASICGDIGFCPSLTTIPAIELVAAHPISRLNQESPSDGPVACTVCKMVVQKVEVILKDKKTEAEITAAMEKVCSLLPTSLARQCQAFIDQYGPVIIQLLVNQMDPQQVCSYIRLCKNNQELQYQAGELCTVCEFAMTELDKLILDQSTIADVEAALDKLCSLLPSTLSDSCQSFVDTYTETIVQLIVKEVSPKLICRAIGVCQTQQPTCAVQKYEIGPTCTLCRYVIGWLERKITSQSTMTEIEQLLEKVCNIVPKTMRSQCQTFVDKYIPQVLDLVVKFVSPRMICTAIHLCIIEEVPIPEPQVEANEFCAICEFAMSELDKLLTQPSTEAEIEKALDEVCGLLPATVSETCKSFVSEYTREIIFLITQSISPKQVCTALTLCTAESVKEVKQEKSPVPITEDDFEASTECIICEFAFRELEEQLKKNATEEDIKKALQEVCTFLPEPLQEDCNLLVTYYTTEVIYQLLRKYPANKICTLLKVCAAVDGELTAVTHLDVQLAPECAICEFVARELEKMLQKDSTEDAIRKALDSVCEFLPSTVTKDCEMFVAYYTEEIIFILVSQFPPDKICSSIQLCGAADVKLLNEETAVEANEPKSSPECVICEFVARELEGMLQMNSTEAEIEKALESVCSRLPATVAKDCTMFVDYYTQEIVFILVSQFPPDKLCTTLRLCGQTTTVEVEVKEPQASSITCELCDYVMKYLESVLSDNATEAEIEAALEKVCSLVPSTYRAACDAFVQEYTPEIVKLILSEVSPSEVCSALGLCSSIKDDPSISCEVCIIAIRTAELYITKNSTEQEIDKILENLCKQFPGTLQEQCVSFVQAFGNAIPELIVTFVNPEKVCTLLDVCPKEVDSKYLLFERCKTGPEFWCATQANADLCNAVEHCKRHVWN
ncbi:Prosaposin [Holothuria leucospilota]|uniref:Prosaposin n=1 Tax=Holothuria leucospilota TaxID=206669 RepID=A0A9Q0YHZ3_HOLLE|nr:Prosaposin [Holothuria leucospilota]